MFVLTPPRWLRHFVPWAVLSWLDRRLPTCWCHIVDWKMGNDSLFSNDWLPNEDCWDGPAGREFDYCGKYKTRAAFDRVVKR